MDYLPVTQVPHSSSPQSHTSIQMPRIPMEILLRVFRNARPKELYTVLPLVCREWAILAREAHHREGSVPLAITIAPHTREDGKQDQNAAYWNPLDLTLLRKPTLVGGKLVTGSVVAKLSPHFFALAKERGVSLETALQEGFLPSSGVHRGLYIRRITPVITELVEGLDGSWSSFHGPAEIPHETSVSCFKDILSGLASSNNVQVLRVRSDFVSLMYHYCPKEMNITSVRSASLSGFMPHNPWYTASLFHFFPKLDTISLPMVEFNTETAGSFARELKGLKLRSFDTRLTLGGLFGLPLVFSDLKEAGVVKFTKTDFDNWTVGHKRVMPDLRVLSCQCSARFSRKSLKELALQFSKWFPNLDTLRVTLDTEAKTQYLKGWEHFVTHVPAGRIEMKYYTADDRSIYAKALKRACKTSGKKFVLLN